MIGGYTQTDYFRKGFTIVELLIVIVVIAILAAIVTVAYNGVRERAEQSVAQDAATEAAKKLAVHAVDNNETFPSHMSLEGLGIKDTSTTTYRYSLAADAKSYCLTLTSKNTYTNVSNTKMAGSLGRCAQHEPTTITNLSVNGSSEVNFTGYSRYGATGTTTRVTNAPEPPYGTAVAGAVFTASGSGGIYFGNSAATRPDVTPGQSYAVSFFVRTNTASPIALSPRIGWVNASVAEVGSTNIDTIQVGNTGWKKVVIVGTAPAGATEMIVYAAANDPVIVSGTRIYMDGLMITQGTEVYPYSDGSTPGWSWSGTEHGSTSTGLSL